jgi:hypothetical protein
MNYFKGRDLAMQFGMPTIMECAIGFSIHTFMIRMTGAITFRWGQASWTWQNILI